MSSRILISTSFRTRALACLLGLSALAIPSNAASGPLNVARAFAISAKAPAASGVTLLDEALTSDRFLGLPAGTLQVTLAYDGDVVGFGPSLNIQFRDPNSGNICWHLIDSAYDTTPISAFGTKIHTYEFDISTYEPTGLVVVDGVVANGSVDGLAFGLFWKNASAGYRMLKSNMRVAVPTTNYFGAWPIAMDYATFQARTTQLGSCTDGELCRRGAQAALWGAQLLPDGIYHLNRSVHRIAAQ